MTIHTAIDMRPAAATELTVAERAELGRYEAVISRGLETFLDVCRAFMAIRDQQLYRATHATFDAYCSERWDIGRSRMYQLIDAAQVVENLEKSTVVDMPSNERQIRPLAGLEPDQQVAAWKQATEVASGKPTAAQVQQAAADAIRPHYAPVWELEGKVAQWMAVAGAGDTDLLLQHLKAYLLKGQWGRKLAAWLDAGGVAYRVDEITQAINNVHDQRRQAKLQAASKVVYVEPVKAEPSEPVTEILREGNAHRSEPEDTETIAEPSAEELAAIAAVEAEREQEEQERLARAERERVQVDPVVTDLLVRSIYDAGFRQTLRSATLAQLEAALRKIAPMKDPNRFMKIGNRRELLLTARGVAEMVAPAEQPVAIDAPTLLDLSTQIDGYITELEGVQTLMHEIVRFIADEMANDGPMRAHVDNVRRDLATLIDKLNERK